MLIMSGIGYSIFTQDFLIIEPRINYKILFGCGIGIGILFFVGIWFFLTAPNIICHYIFTFPAFFIILSIYIAFLVPSAFREYMDIWDEKWEDSSSSQVLQIHNKCCGWNNFTDRGLEKCQFDAESGCKKFISHYLKPRFKSLLIIASLSLGLSIISFVCLVLACSVGGEDDLLAHFDSN